MKLVLIVVMVVITLMKFDFTPWRINPKAPFIPSFDDYIGHV
jgi:hypothetical protein